MGCDIHVYREVKRGDRWESLETFERSLFDDEVVELTSPHIGRDYTLFSLLASGVRGDYPFSFPQRGLPHDVSDHVEAESDHWEADGHSHSHLLLSELLEKPTELLITNGEDAQEAALRLRRFIKDLDFPADKSPKNCRVVFWFDN